MTHSLSGAGRCTVRHRKPCAFQIECKDGDNCQLIPEIGTHMIGAHPPIAMVPAESPDVRLGGEVHVAAKRLSDALATARAAGLGVELREEKQHGPNCAVHCESRAPHSVELIAIVTRTIRL